MFNYNDFTHMSIGQNESESEFSIREIKAPERSESLELGEIRRKKKKRGFFGKLKYILLACVFAIVLGGGYFLYETSSAFDKMTGQNNSLIKTIAKMLPLGDNIFQILPVESQGTSPVDEYKNNKLDRLNILLLGYRGVDDPNGGLLTDTMMVASFQKSTGKVALISVPRDLYVKLPHSEEKGKINEAHALGMKNGGWQGGLSYSKQEIEDVTGLDIHYVVSVDFKAFQEIIDTLGGITVTLDKPFVEKVPFAEGSISLPAGTSNLTGMKALLYSRARESSSDFERARRQQQVLVATKEKALSLGVISNPVKMVAIITSVGNHVRTDAQLWELQELVGVFSNISTSNISQKVFDTSANGLLSQGHTSGGAYILQPVGGNYDKLHEACKNIFDVPPINKKD